MTDDESLASLSHFLDSFKITDYMLQGINSHE